MISQSKSGLQRGIAADVVGMGMGVDQAAERNGRRARGGRGDGLFGMVDVAAVDQRRPVAIETQDIVGRQPAAFEDEQAVGRAVLIPGVRVALVSGLHARRQSARR